MTAKVKDLKSFDGDGWVLETSLVRYDIGTPYLRVTVNSGNHQTTLEVRPDETAAVLEMLEHGAKRLAKEAAKP